MAVDAPAQTSTPPDNVPFKSIKSFRIYRTEENWLEQLLTNLQLFQTAFSGPPQRIKVFFSATYDVPGEENPRTDVFNDVELTTEFTTRVGKTAEYQNSRLYATDLVSYLHQAIIELEQHFNENVREVVIPGYDDARQLAQIPGSSVYSEAEVFDKKKDKVREALDRITEYCANKLEEQTEQVPETTHVLDSFSELVTRDPLSSWDTSIAALNGVSGIRALAEAFRDTADTSPYVVISTIQVSVSELKAIFDLFQRSIKENIVDVDSYTYAGKRLSVAKDNLLTEPQKNSIQKLEFRFDVLGNTNFISAGGEDNKNIRAFLSFYEKVIKFLRGEIEKETSATQVEETETEDSGGGESEQLDEQQLQTRTLTLEELIEETTALFAQRVFEAYEFQTRLAKLKNPVLLQQFILENLQRLIIVEYGDQITDWLKNPEINHEFYTSETNLYFANPACFRWQTELIQTNLTELIIKLEKGIHSEEFIQGQIASAQVLAGQVVDQEEVDTDELGVGIIPANLDQLKSEYAAASPDNLNVFDEKVWSSLSWEERSQLPAFKTINRQTNALVDTTLLAALGQMGLTDVDITTFKLSPELRQQLQQEIRDAFYALPAEDWLVIQESSVIPVGIYQRVLTRVLPRVTQEGSLFDTQLRTYLVARLVSQQTGASLEEVLARFGISEPINPELLDENLRQLYSTLGSETQEQTKNYLLSLSTAELAVVYTQRTTPQLVDTLTSGLGTQARAFSLGYLGNKRQDITKKMRALGVGLDADGHLAITEALVTVLGPESLAFIDVATRGQLSEILGISLKSLTDSDFEELKEYLRQYLQTNLDRRFALMSKPTTAFLPFTAREFAQANTAITRSYLRKMGSGHHAYGDNFTYATQLSDLEIEASALEKEQASAVFRLKQELWQQTLGVKPGQQLDWEQYGIEDNYITHFQDPEVLAGLSLAYLSNYQAGLLGPEAVLPSAGQTPSRGWRRRFGLGKKQPNVLANKAANAALGAAVPGYSAAYKVGEALLGKENMQRLQMALLYGGAVGAAKTLMIIATGTLAKFGFGIGSFAGSALPGLGTITGGITGAWVGHFGDKLLTGSGAATTQSGAGTAAGTATGIGSGAGFWSNIGTSSVVATTTVVTTTALVASMAIQNAMLVDVPMGNIQAADNPDLEVIKDATPAMGVGPDQEVRYTLTIKTNNGKRVTDITLVDELDPNRFNIESLAMGEATGATCSVASNVISCEVEDLGPTNQATIAYTIRTKDTLSPDGETPASNTVTVRGTLDGVEISDVTTRTLNSSGSQVAEASWNIVSGLQQGWWNYYNYHTAYPELFNQNTWVSSPASWPPPYTGSSRFTCGKPGDRDYYSGPYPCIRTRSPNDMFWCTWNVIYTMEAVGTPIPRSLTGVLGMRAYFKNNAYYLGTDSGGSVTVSDIQVGDVAFFGKGDVFSAHVAIVGEVTERSVVTYDSNNYDIKITYQVVNGIIEPNGPVYLNGIGRL